MSSTTIDMTAANLITDKNLVGVMPELASAVRLVLADLANEEYCFAVFMGYRTLEQQTALYEQGREDIAYVNLLRQKAGMAPLDAVENRIVTGLKVSFHNFGLAVDIVEDGDPEKTGMQWSWAQVTDYLRIQAIAQMRGLEWGGLWKSLKDYPHLQLTGGLGINDCAALYRSGGQEAVWQAVRSKLNFPRTL